MASQPQAFHSMAPPLVPKPAFLGVIWAGTAVGTMALAFRYYVRTKNFHHLLIDDFFAGFAWILLVSTAILWTVIINDFYEIKYVLSGMKMPDANLFYSLGRYLHGSLAVLFIFYVELWCIKINFLIFFRKLGDQVRHYQIYWWIVTLFTVAAGAVCIGTIQYDCLGSVEKAIAECAQPSAVRFEDVTLKVNCALDVLTDALSEFLPFVIGMSTDRYSLIHANINPLESPHNF
ncbi:hypothetical protein OCU04_011598 [Sclerotinia nivalis]|uniref:Integral membrane protein n=1 Tax=Sclerotinia nivalis TaxID=352851 RepID=A0A9X0DEX4_9HELO|nr:hypothetical protein OCU04_011598 [Sclerotinia nivalis]